ncbi:MAG: 5'-nucleotidase [Methylococcaceae bacterium]|nr:5'-nucleotidase [Methylococcaceae bacterium]
MRKQKLVVAISSRALFNLDESHAIFETQGKEAFCRYQIDHEDEVLEAGYGFALVKKFLAINESCPDDPFVEIVLVSQNSADTGLRIFNSIAYHHLFLSTNVDDVTKTLAAGFAAATILSGSSPTQTSNQLRIAFDGDAVLFSDESERIYQQRGLEIFAENERHEAKNPLPGGPFKDFLSALHHIQNQFEPDKSPIRTALVTARSAPAHERVVRTLRAWGIRIDEALFLGGLPKGAFLKAFGADIFFDDQKGHCESAVAQQVSAAHVPHGGQKSTAHPTKLMASFDFRAFGLTNRR